jgi:hypothetical protein
VVLLVGHWDKIGVEAGMTGLGFEQVVIQELTG